MFKRNLILAYGLACYLAFLATFLYAVGFLTNLVVPRSIDAAASGSLVLNLGVDLGLLSVFALQHSVMARRGFKRWLTRWLPESAERSTYVLASSLALAALFAFWRPLGGTVWSVSQPQAATALYVVAACGWLLVLVSTFLINHFDLFGLRQVWLQWRGITYRHVPFKTPGPYRLVRHPLYLGWLLAFWATPQMTVTHLLFAVVTTLYILAAIPLEERDLIATLGDVYREYRERVPELLPRLGASRRAVEEAAVR